MAWRFGTVRQNRKKAPASNESEAPSEWNWRGGPEESAICVVGKHAQGLKLLRQAKRRRVRNEWGARKRDETHRITIRRSSNDGLRAVDERQSMEPIGCSRGIQQEWVPP